MAALMVWSRFLILHNAYHKIVAGHLLPAPSADIGMVKARLTP